MSAWPFDPSVVAHRACDMASAADPRREVGSRACADEAAVLTFRSTKAPLLWDGRRGDARPRDCPGDGGELLRRAGTNKRSVR
jgi:hypothetical protein